METFEDLDQTLIRAVFFFLFSFLCFSGQVLQKNDDFLCEHSFFVPRLQGISFIFGSFSFVSLLAEVIRVRLKMFLLQSVSMEKWSPHDMERESLVWVGPLTEERA